MGPRMHSTIASLTSEVPTVGFAYSDKMQGIFDLFKMGQTILDMRKLTIQDALSIVINTFENRDEIKKKLAIEAKKQILAAQEQAKEICHQIQSIKS